MDEKILRNISMVAIILGLGFLVFFVDEVEFDSAERIDDDVPGSTVKVQGVVQRVSAQEKVFFANILGEKVEELAVVIFPERELFIREGDYIEVEGTLEEYEGKKEVIANKVIVK
jgi:aspartyl/asparaginyl-tRNA synthetase